MKVEMDCSQCSGRSCCSLRVYPYGLEMICVRHDSGTCSIEDDKPVSCKLYPFVLVMNEENQVAICLDTNCPKWETADLVQALQVIAEHGDELIIIAENELQYFNFDLRILGTIS